MLELFEWTWSILGEKTSIQQKQETNVPTSVNSQQKCVWLCQSWKIKLSTGPEKWRGTLSLLFWKAAARPEHLVWRSNRGRWACMVPAEAVSTRATAAVPAIVPETPRMRGKASSPPVFGMSPRPPASTTAVSVGRIFWDYGCQFSSFFFNQTANVASPISGCFRPE